MHGAALTLGIAIDAAGQFSHDAPGFHAAGQHMRVIAIAGNHLVALSRHRLQTNNDGFLPDIEMTKTANLAHRIDLAAALFKTTNARHIAPHRNQLLV